jgi:hypothetical protein
MLPMILRFLLKEFMPWFRPCPTYGTAIEIHGQTDTKNTE